MIPLRLYLYAAAVLAILAALWGYGRHERAQGRAEIQAKWDAHEAKRTEELLAANLANQETALLKRKAVDRSRDVDAQIAKSLAVANADLRSSVNGLLGDLAAGRDPAKTGGAATPGSLADGGATVARELLGECSERYAGVAEEAGKLSAQVIGLQGYVRAIQPAD